MTSNSIVFLVDANNTSLGLASQQWAQFVTR
jgi:hypothetical protein